MNTLNPTSRFGAALPLAAGITFALFFAMQLLVAEKGVIPLDEKPAGHIEIYQYQRPAPPPPSGPADVDDVKPPELPPIDPMPNSPNTGTGVTFQGTVIEAPQPGLYLGNTDPVARVQITPIYPRRPLLDGVEGYVVLEFTVLPDGSVADIKVVEETPKGYGFAKAAMLAAAKFKYEPKVMNGKKVATAGVREKFNFELTD